MLRLKIVLKYLKAPISTESKQNRYRVPKKRHPVTPRNPSKCRKVSWWTLPCRRFKVRPVTQCPSRRPNHSQSCQRASCKNQKLPWARWRRAKSVKVHRRVLCMKVRLNLWHLVRMIRVKLLVMLIGRYWWFMTNVASIYLILILILTTQQRYF